MPSLPKPTYSEKENEDEDLGAESAVKEEETLATNANEEAQAEDGEKESDELADAISGQSSKADEAGEEEPETKREEAPA